MSLPYLGEFRITKLYGAPPPPGMTYSAGKHPGLDLVGTDKLIRAVLGGTVHRAGCDYNGWGKYIVVKQTDNLYAIYAHLSKAYKAAGQQVKTGETIGVEGSTGKSTGSHLHFELRKNYSDKYATIDPAPYLGLVNKVGKAEVNEVKKQITIGLCGSDKTVTAIECDGNNYVRLQDLRCDHIVISNVGAKPIISTK